MLANVLDTPISKLPVSHDIDTCKHFFDTGTLPRSNQYRLKKCCEGLAYLVLFQTVLKNVLNN